MSDIDVHTIEKIQSDCDFAMLELKSKSRAFNRVQESKLDMDVKPIYTLTQTYLSEFPYLHTSRHIHLCTDTQKERIKILENIQSTLKRLDTQVQKLEDLEVKDY